MPEHPGQPAGDPPGLAVSTIILLLREASILTLKRLIGQTRLELVQGDITHQGTDAIVNAANNSLLGGGGVDGAIHAAAGPELLEECRTLGGCETGEAKITNGYRLKARHVIHTVGPVYHGWRRDAVLLARCYEQSLALVSVHHLRSLAFPSISTGVYSYPLDEAAPIALKAAILYLSTHEGIELVRFVLYDRQTFEAYARALEQLVT
jgi:O-acetyl-ADP-ribose deacetylase (regulator of RNase III)